MNSLNKFIIGFAGGMAFAAVQNLQGQRGDVLLLQVMWAFVFLLTVFSLLRDMWKEFFNDK